MAVCYEPHADITSPDFEMYADGFGNEEVCKGANIADMTNETESRKSMSRKHKYVTRARDMTRLAQLTVVYTSCPGTQFWIQVYHSNNYNRNPWIKMCRSLLLKLSMTSVLMHNYWSLLCWDRAKYMRSLVTECPSGSARRLVLELRSELLSQCGVVRSQLVSDVTTWAANHNTLYVCRAYAVARTSSTVQCAVHWCNAIHFRYTCSIFL